MQFDLKEYIAQRLIRQKKRNQFTLKFQSIKSKINKQKLPQSQVQPKQLLIQQFKQKQSSNSNDLDQQYQLLLAQNNNIKNQLQQSQRKSVNKMKQMKSQIAALKENYLNEMKKITDVQRTQKSGSTDKLNLIIKQIKDAEIKNQQLESNNKILEQEFKTSQKQLDDMLSQIKNQYEQKLKQFEIIMIESKQKINQMEAGINQQQLVKNALKNEKLIQTLIQNSQLDEKRGTKEQFQEILSTKNQIIINLTKNNKMKQIEIKKIKQLTEKFKTVFESLNAEKKQIIEENQKMTGELIQIKKIFNAALGNPSEDVEVSEQQSQQEQQQQENQDQ